MAGGLPDLSARATKGTLIAARVRPGARRSEIDEGEAGVLRISVSAAPEGGRANEAVRRLLARALGIAPSRLTLVRGETARDKLFRVD